jgi:hypothetical protein
VTYIYIEYRCLDIALSINQLILTKYGDNLYSDLDLIRENRTLWFPKLEPPVLHPPVFFKCHNFLVRAPNHAFHISILIVLMLIQVTRTATKHANINILTWIWSIFLQTSLGVEGWLGIRWVVGFCWFEWFLLFVIMGARNKLGNTFSPLSLHLSKPTPNLYVN